MLYKFVPFRNRYCNYEIFDILVRDYRSILLLVCGECFPERPDNLFFLFNRNGRINFPPLPTKFSFLCVVRTVLVTVA